MSVFLLSFALFLSLVFINQTVGNDTRASNSLKPSVNTSFILSFPLEVVGTEPSTITVFVRDEDTKPLPNRAVTLSSSIGSINTPNLITDGDGKATAEFTCNNVPSGIAQINAIIDDTLSLTKTVTIKCN